MKSFLFVTLALCFASFSSADSGVVVLTDNNFDTIIDGSTHALVEFYAPWCGHCKNLAPEYEKVGSTFSKKDGVIIAKVDATAEKGLGDRFGIRGFPTLKWFSKGSTSAVDYESGRSADDMVSFINGKTGMNKKIKSAPSNVLALTPGTFDAVVMDPSNHALVEFYAPWCGHCKALAPKYEEVGKTFAQELSVIVAKVDSEKHRDLASKYGVTGYPTLKYFPSGSNKEPEAYNGGREAQNFVDFLNEKAGTSRKLGGALDESAGLMEEFKDLVDAFPNVDVDAAQEILDKMTGEVAKNGKLYVNIFKKIVKRGTNYVKDEASRLSRMLASGSVNPKKKDLFSKRLNILKTFNE